MLPGPSLSSQFAGIFSDFALKVLKGALMMRKVSPFSGKSCFECTQCQEDLYQLGEKAQYHV
jgi:hypothetical protein